MSIPGSINPLFLGAAGQATGGGEYQIERSVRFNSADSAYLNRTPASAGNRQSWSWSGWVKQGNLSTGRQVLFGGYGALNDTDWIEFGFDTNNFYYTVNSVASKSPAVFRDVSAWQHVVVTYNGSSLKWYSNGVEVHSVSITGNLGINGNWVHTIGKSPNSSQSRYFDGYLADIHFIDGQALTPTSFGEFDTNGVWQPKAFSGSYGTNGFHLPFSDNSTAAALGTDTSGNGNTWTVNNISVTAGAGNDSLVDSPTSYGTPDTGVGNEVRGNYCTWNPLANTAGALSNGNLQLGGTSGASVRCNSTLAISSGKWYFESTLTNASQYTSVGVGQGFITNLYPGQDALSYAQTLEQGTRINNNSQPGYGTALTSGDVFMCAFDLDNNKIFFGKNGTWFNSSNPAAGTNPAYTLAAGTYCPIARPYGSGAVINTNFGQRPFAYTAPSGFKALCTTNLPEPTIADGSTAMDVKLYTGNGSTQTISGLNFSPDLVWIKNRNVSGYWHEWFDVVRGVSRRLFSNDTSAEDFRSGQLVTSFNSDGFSLTYVDAYDNGNNSNGNTFVAWCWDAGTTTASNTDGSITSQVRANASAGFSVVTWTGTGASTSIGHGLGVAPTFAIIKRRNSAQDWYVPTTVISGLLDYLALNKTDASAWTGVSVPSSTVFNLGTGASNNASGATYVGYFFAPVAGYSAFGRYTGNGLADGVFAYLGFLPKLILIKRTNTTSNWTILDTLREGYNVDNDPLYPNLSNAEGTTDLLDITSNGFKLRTTDASVNANTGTYVYAAWASNPFQYSRAR
jgi:hypothetical protein